MAYTALGNDQRLVNSTLDHILDFIRRLPAVDVTKHHLELMTYHPHAS